MLNTITIETLDNHSKTTIDPEVKQIIHNIFFLVVITLLLLNIFKFTYIVVVLCKVMFSDNESVKQYPSALSCCCEVFSSLLMIGICVCGLIAALNPRWTLILSLIFCTAILASFFSGFISLILLCDTENATQHSISYGAISLTILIIESLSITIGSFYSYYQFKQLADNPDSKLEIWPFN